VAQRTFLEEFARDSLENLVFAVCRFKEVTGRYPKQITVVGLEMKRRRFEDLHRAAIAFPASQFEYVGVDPAAKSAAMQIKRSVAAAATTAVDIWPRASLDVDTTSPDHKTLAFFARDPFGCLSPLVDKRAQRDPFKRQHGDLGYAGACPEMNLVFQACSSGRSSFSDTQALSTLWT
jgi:hypothetical protein